VANKDTMHNLFDLGYLSLEDRARGEALFNRIAERVSKVVADLKYVPDEFEDLPALLADKYICNFSLFQSLPDSWAINALFPITPLSRLDERPNRRGTIVDISCDSDGKIEKFVDLRDVKNTLPLHELRRDEPYYLGVFLMGAYQDVLGSAHNLFGKVNEAHVMQQPDGGFDIELFVRGQKARRLIESMGYEAPDLSTGIEVDVNEAIEAGRVNSEEGEQFMELYNEELVGYTYLEYEREEPEPDLPSP
jgi:arginine decarboxylase